MGPRRGSKSFDSLEMSPAALRMAADRGESAGVTEDKMVSLMLHSSQQLYRISILPLPPVGSFEYQLQFSF